MANDTQKKAASLKEAWKLNWRACGIWHKICPGIFASRMLKGAAAAITPYVTVWFSAKLLGELAGARDPARLRLWVVLTLTASALMALVNGLLTHWDQYESPRADVAEDRLFAGKMQSLDFVDLDGQPVHDLYAQICQNRNWARWGMVDAIVSSGQFVQAAVQLFVGLLLVFSLFFARVPEGSALAWLDHPLCTAAFWALLLGVTRLSTKCGEMADRYWAAASSDARFTNRFFHYACECARQRWRALDLRLYRQMSKRIVPLQQREQDVFSTGSHMARVACGPQGLLIGLEQVFLAVLSGLAYTFVGLKAWAGAFGVGMVTQYVGALTQIFSAASMLFMALSVIRLNAPFLQQCFELLDYPNRMYQGSLTTEKRSDRKYTVEFRDVSFQYPGSEQYALRHVNMKFKVGSRLAVVGRNGSGKTTFIKLLCRLYDPTEGAILLNGIDIRKYRYDEYMDIFSVVFQDFKLLALPLGQNVAALQSYDAARAEDCLQKAGFGERLAALPHGLDTYLYKDMDKEGVEVSGGEAQKIAIARALYKDAPFIILDEPTAALDPIAEAEIYSKFNDIAGDKTAIYISHRLSSCKFCDEIAVFDGGSVVQQGTHEGLLADASGLYCALWNAQAQYYAEGEAVKE